MRSSGSVIIILCLFAVACGGASPNALVRAPVAADRDGDGILDQQDADPDVAKPPAAPTPTARNVNNIADAKDEEPNSKQHIVYSARVTMAVFEVERGIAAVESLARNMGGYLASKHDREITIRVPRARFEPSLVAIDKVGDVLHRDVKADDVTDEFVDIDVRITNARAMQGRLRLLLEKAAVKEALDIEKELSRVTQDLELLEGKMKVLKDKIAYSTITVLFEPRNARAMQTRTRLPFVWLSQLGLPTLLTLSEDK